MEEIFRKVKLPNGKHKYVSIGYEYNRDVIPQGIWLVTRTPGSMGMTGLIYKIGDIKQADIMLHGNLQAYSNEVASYLSRLTDVNDTIEQKEAKEILGAYYQDNPAIYNISMGDLASLILRKLATLIQRDNAITTNLVK